AESHRRLADHWGRWVAHRHRGHAHDRPRAVTLSLWVAVALGAGNATPGRGEALLEHFFAAWEKVHAITYRLHKVERLRDGEVTVEESDVKLRRPMAVYLAAV